VTLELGEVAFATAMLLGRFLSVAVSVENQKALDELDLVAIVWLKSNQEQKYHEIYFRFFLARSLDSVDF